MNEPKILNILNKLGPFALLHLRAWCKRHDRSVIGDHVVPPVGFLLENGNCAVLVDVSDVHASAQAMIQLGRSSEDRERLGNKARDSAWARFHPRVVVPIYEQIYDQILRA